MKFRRWDPPRRIGQNGGRDARRALEELRQRLFVCVGAVIIVFIAAYVVQGRIIDALENALPREHGKLATLTIGEPFMTAMCLSLYAGFLFALPIVLWQGSSSFAPAVDPGHEKMMRLFVALSTALLALGVVFGNYLELPAGAHLLTNYDSHQY